MRSFIVVACLGFGIAAGGCGKSPESQSKKAELERRVNEMAASVSSAAHSSGITYSLDPSKSMEMIEAAKAAADAGNKTGGEMQKAMDQSDQAQ